MQERPRGGLAERQRTLLLRIGTPVVGLALLAALLAARDAREATHAAFLERAREQGRAVEAVLGAAGDSEAGDEVPAGDRASRLDRARQLVGGLDWPAGEVRLVAPSSGDPAEADRAEDPEHASLLLVQPLAGGAVRLEHPLPAASLAAAARAAALPWLVAAAALGVVLAVVHLLLGRRLLVPAEHSLAALAEIAAGRPPAPATLPDWAAPWLEAARAGARREAERLAGAEAALALLEAALEAASEGVAVLDPEGRLLFVNGALRERVGGAAGDRLRPGAPLDPTLRPTLLAEPGAREVRLGDGGAMLLVPAGSAACGPTTALSARAGPRLAGMVQEVGETLAQVARQAMLLHELAPDPTTRERASELRRAAERCNRAIAPLVVPRRPLPPRPVAVERLGCGHLSGSADRPSDAAGTDPADPENRDPNLARQTVVRRGEDDQGEMRDGRDAHGPPSTARVRTAGGPAAR